MNTTPKIHPNAPPKLVKKLYKCGSFHKLADEIGVNVAHIHRLITAGIEPTDRTEHGREIRQRLSLPRYKRRQRARRKETKNQKAIRQMVKATKEAIT